MQQALSKLKQLVDAGDSDGALELARRILERDPSQLVAWRVVASLTPDTREAVRAARQISTLNPDDPWLERFLPKLERRITQEALRERQKGRDLSRRGINPLQVMMIASAVVGVILLGTLFFARGQIEIPPLVFGDESSFTPNAVAADNPDAGESPGSSASSNNPPPTAQPPAEEPPPPTQAGGNTRSLYNVPPVAVSYDTETYTFEATFAEDIQEAIITHGPEIHSGQKAAAATRSAWELAMQTRQEDNICVVTDLQVNLGITYIYPEWIRSGITHIPTEEEWERFMERVVAHEEQHAAIEIGCAEDLAQRLFDEGTFEACNVLEARYQALANEVRTACENQHVAYDNQEGLVSFPLGQ